MFKTSILLIVSSLLFLSQNSFARNSCEIYTKFPSLPKYQTNRFNAHGNYGFIESYSKDELPENYLLIDEGDSSRLINADYSKVGSKGQYLTQFTLSLVENKTILKKANMLIVTESMLNEPARHSWFDVLDKKIQDESLRGSGMQVAIPYTKKFEKFKTNLYKQHEKEVTQKLQEEISSIIQNSLCDDNQDIAHQS